LSRPDNAPLRSTLPRSEQHLLQVGRVSNWPRLYLFLLLALTTGACRGKLLGLRYGDLDLEQSLTCLGRAKNGQRAQLSVPHRDTGHAMIQLFYYPGNASLTPHILLEEIGAPFELVLVDRSKAAHKSAEYLKLNPNGQIPVLLNDGLVLYETAAICLYLADLHPQAKLAPPLQTAERAHFYQWLVWCTNTLQAMLMHYFYGERLVDEGDAAAAEQVKNHAEARIGGMLDRLDEQLASHGGEWLLGPKFSAVDPYALMLCRWTRGFSHPARNLPRLGPYLQRVLARPAVQRAFATEKLSTPFV
jgi:glutathione S-transferase